ncbi:MAG: 5-amino-6-(D-ribitylamino)uracil--L-tyrosine 4-hydroxyphenyl transferase CofH [Synechococcaceae cyanobacterium SM2_3_1]|nr:5-amino-6-(D-ribitylamino)uracil--L-tyrosine 4-hydroxyphenyl transferase CofH [Synechococcaceae cyanobacterium SM2_3_1]
MSSLITTLAAECRPATVAEAKQLAELPWSSLWLEAAAHLRDQGFGKVITYSRKVFLPLTQLCRDRCHYCTFAHHPQDLDTLYMSQDQVLQTVETAATVGCKEALFTLGERPESRYPQARSFLDQAGYSSTLEYLGQVAAAVYQKTGVLPHLNPGTLTSDQLLHLRPVAVSMGLMLESGSERLTQRGMPHFGSPDKVPAVRLKTLEAAGELQIPFTTGLLIGIGETRQERIADLLNLQDLDARFGHLQEIIIQPFRVKPGTGMSYAPEPDLDELLWTLCVARLIFGPKMSIQTPPNLSPDHLPQLIQAGINDWGGVSPLTPDYVNPEAPWPDLERLAAETAAAGKHLEERLTLYPRYTRDLSTWVDLNLHAGILRLMDSDGFARPDPWISGFSTQLPEQTLHLIQSVADPSAEIRDLSEKASAGLRLQEEEVVKLLSARGSDFAWVCQTADQLRQQVCGDKVTFVVNRNINYTNICAFKCQFCAFSKGKTAETLRGHPYDLDLTDIGQRTREAWDRGATEVCLQGGIHPSYTGAYYLKILETVRTACPDIHIHAFSPLEVWQGAQTLNQPLAEFLLHLKAAGLNTLPGTAAEVLDDNIRQIICPDKVTTAEWLAVMRTAHSLGLRSTATLLFGHIESSRHVARHLLRIRDLQTETGGFTEFVPLPFVAQEAPLYVKGQCRRGPTFREAMLVHAVSRLVLHPLIPNIQASWVKLGHRGAQAALQVGANDLGGTLMNESISRAAGASHGQETTPQQMINLILEAGRIPQQRSTLYGIPAP